MANHQIQSNPELHSFSSHAELAAAALGSVVAANEFGKAVSDHDDHETDRFVKAAVAATVAIGAYEMLRKKMEPHHSHPGGGYPTTHPTPSDPKHHKRHMVEEAAGLYALGRELLGDKKHHITHLVAEAVGATGLIKELRDRVP
jgi:hypothetical protein